MVKVKKKGLNRSNLKKDKKSSKHKHHLVSDEILFSPLKTMSKAGETWNDFLIEFNSKQYTYDVLNFKIGNINILIDKVEGHPIKLRVSENAVIKNYFDGIDEVGHYKILTKEEAVLDEL